MNYLKESLTTSYLLRYGAGAGDHNQEDEEELERHGRAICLEGPPETAAM